MKQCLFCSSPDVKQYYYPRSTSFNNKRFTYLKCVQCKLVFIDPIPDDSDYRAMYSESYHNDFYFKDNSNALLISYEDILKQFAGGRILDYGCGDATYLNNLEKLNIQRFGVEYDPELVKRLQSRFGDIQFYTVEEFSNKKNEKFDIIHLGDVLEHMAKPQETLKYLYGQLNQNGILIVEGPLEDNFTLAHATRKVVSKIIAKIKGRNASNHFPYHITFSNAQNQLALFRLFGLKTMRYKVFEVPWPYPSKPVFPVSNSIKYSIAKLSIFISRNTPFKWGNRFLYIGKK